MKTILVPSATSNILHVKLYDSSSTTGAGLTGLTSASAGLKISTICDNEASATTYTVAGSTIESIATLGTYAAPTATKCRFKELDSTNHPGVYQLMFADARFAVSNATSMLISISGATNLAQYDTEVQFGGLLPKTSATNFYNAYNGTGYTDGTAQAGSSSTITLAAGETATDNLLTPCIITIVGGTGAGQSRYAYSYVGSTKVASVRPNWTTSPDSTSTYVKSPCPDLLRAIVCDSAGDYTAQQILSLVLAAVAGQWTATGTFKTPDGTGTRIVGTASSSAPFRSGITLTPSS